MPIYWFEVEGSKSNLPGESKNTTSLCRKRNTLGSIYIKNIYTATWYCASMQSVTVRLQVSVSGIFFFLSVFLSDSRLLRHFLATRSVTDHQNWHHGCIKAIQSIKPQRQQMSCILAWLELSIARVLVRPLSTKMLFVTCFCNRWVCEY